MHNKFVWLEPDLFFLFRRSEISWRKLSMLLSHRNSHASLDTLVCFSFKKCTYFLQSELRLVLRDETQVENHAVLGHEANTDYHIH
jgi:hypothetical protein